mgnify:CR=1 FL=1
MSEESILIERDGALGWIRINRPERLNAFSGDMRQRIEAGLQELEDDADVRVVLITGVGRAFSTGGDIQVMTELAEQRDTEAFRELVEAGERVVTLIDRMEKPVIAVVNGPAAGAGACLALACDLRIASETASIGFTFVRVGLHPDWGGTYFLPRLIGPALAAEMIYTGGMIRPWPPAPGLPATPGAPAPPTAQLALNVLWRMIRAAPASFGCSSCGIT